MQILHRIRVEKGLTQQQLSKILKVSQSCISKIEDGRLKPNVLVIARLWATFPEKRKELDKYFKELI